MNEQIGEPTMCAAHRLLAAIVPCLLVAAASAQNPVQWKGNARAAIEEARAQTLPLMFWVTERQNWNDDDDLRDAQENAFRDPAVVRLSRSHFIPVRVSRNSNVLKVAEEFGLPTTHGLYIAVLTPEGKVLAEIDPGQVAEPTALAARLAEAYQAFRADIYERRVRPVLENPDAPVPEIRTALELVWRLEIQAADVYVVKLLDRPGITPVQKSRLYSLLASLGTDACIERLLTDAVSDREAMKALRTARAGALKFLLGQMPERDPAEASARDPGPGLNERQFAAYQAVCAIARAGQPNPMRFWQTAPAKRQAQELADTRAKAQTVLGFWEDEEGKFR
jgi:hypothetical protein